MSAPETILVEMPLGGVDQYTDAKWTVPGKLAELENARFDRPPALNKRHGYTLLSKDVHGGGTVSVCERIAYLHGETVIFGERLYAYDSVSATWIDRGRIPDPGVSSAKIWSDMRTDLADCDIAYNQQIGVATWSNQRLDSSGVPFDVDGAVNVVVFNRTSGQVLSQELLTPVSGQFEQPKALVVGQYIYVVAIASTTDTTGSVVAWRIDTSTTTYTFTDLGVFVASINPSYGFDACAAGSEFYVAYGLAPLSGSLTLDRFGTASSAVLATYTEGVVPDLALSVAATIGEAVYLAYAGTLLGGGGTIPDVRFVVLHPTTLAVTAGPTNIGSHLVGGGTPPTNVSRMALVRVSGTRRLLVVQDEDVSSLVANVAGLRWTLLSSAGGTPATAKTMSDLSLASKFFSDIGRLYIGVCFDSDEQGTGYLVELGEEAQTDVVRDARWVATFRRGRVSPHDTRSHLPHAQIWSGRSYDLPCRIKQKFRFAGGDDEDIIITQHSIELARFDFSSEPDFVAWGDGTFVAQGRPSWYDGAQYVEHGFAWHPEDASPSFFGSSSGFFDGNAGVEVNAQIVYEWLDARRTLHRSTPSPIIEAQTDPGSLPDTTLRLTLTNGLGLTDRAALLAYWTGLRSASQTVAYRTTQGNPTGPGVEFFRANAPPVGFGTELGTEIEVGDEDRPEDDPDIEGYELIYTSGDILNNDETPPCRLCVVHGSPSRLWLAGLEEADTLAFSQPFVLGEAARFNEGLRLRIGQTITALGSMDDKLVAFTATSVYVVTGNGPPASGDIDVGFLATLVTSDAGCIQPRSVVTTPQGLMFQSGKGLYMLGRDLSLRYVGAPIRRLLDFSDANAFPIITGAALLPLKNEVRFTARDTGNEAGRVYVYDYAQDQWSVDVLPDVPVTCAMIASAFAWATAAGQVYLEDSGFSDGPDTSAANLVSMRVVTPWITPRVIQGQSGTLQGWQALRSVGILGDHRGSHALRIRVAYDFEDTWTDTFTLLGADLAALPHYHVNVAPSRMDCKSFRVEVRDEAADLPINEGFRLASIFFEVDVDRRKALLAPAQVR
jgi:hypothetical protein